MTWTDLRTLPCALILACSSLAACGDDGGSDSGNADTSASSTGADDDTVSVTLSTDDSSGGTLPGTSSEGGSSEGSTGPGESTGTGESTGPGDSTGPGESTGTDDETTAAECVPITEDDSAIGSQCMFDGDCPDGYTCQAMNGIVLQQTCQIICEEACECPSESYTCAMHDDKAMMPWFQCDQL